MFHGAHLLGILCERHSEDARHFIAVTNKQCICLLMYVDHVIVVCFCLCTELSSFVRRSVLAYLVPTITVHHDVPLFLQSLSETGRRRLKCDGRGVFTTRLS